MTDDSNGIPAAETVGTPRRRRTGHGGWQILIVVLLGLTAVATAWSGYQASLWDGIQSSNYTQASAARTEAAQQRSAGNQFRIADLGEFENYIDAVISGNVDVAEFYRQRFRDEFAVAFEAWNALNPTENPEAPSTPLGMPEYKLAADQTADDLEALAHDLFADGEKANTYSDVYTLTTLLFAVTLFFAAIAERFDYVRARIGLVVIGAIGLIAGVAIAVGQPVTGG